METLDRIHIRLPIKAAQQTHITRLAYVNDGNLERANNRMVRKFIECHPWNAYPKLNWRNPLEMSRDTLAIEILLDQNTSDLMMRTISDINTINQHTSDPQINPRMFLATAIHWWIIHVHPLTPEYD